MNSSSWWESQLGCSLHEHHFSMSMARCPKNRVIGKKPTKPTKNPQKSHQTHVGSKNPHQKPTKPTWVPKTHISKPTPTSHRFLETQPTWDPPTHHVLTCGSPDLSLDLTDHVCFCVFFVCYLYINIALFCSGLKISSVTWYDWIWYEVILVLDFLMLWPESDCY